MAKRARALRFSLRPRRASQDTPDAPSADTSAAHDLATSPATAEPARSPTWASMKRGSFSLRPSSAASSSSSAAAATAPSAPTPATTAAAAQATRAEVRANTRSDWSFPELPELAALRRTRPDTPYVERELEIEEPAAREHSPPLFRPARRAAGRANVGGAGDANGINGAGGPSAFPADGPGGLPAADAYRFDGPDDVGDAVAARRARAVRQLRDERRWNAGLRCWMDRRDAWTGAARVRLAGERRAVLHKDLVEVGGALAGSSLLPRRRRDGRRSNGTGGAVKAGNVMESAGAAGTAQTAVASEAAEATDAVRTTETTVTPETAGSADVADTTETAEASETATAAHTTQSTETAEPKGMTDMAATAKTIQTTEIAEATDAIEPTTPRSKDTPSADDSGSRRRDSSSSRRSVASDSGSDSDDSSDGYTTLIPIPPPLIPPDHPIRSQIQPRNYRSIYTKIVAQGTAPSIPVNLRDIVAACVVGWKADGEWPPKSSYPEPQVAMTNGHQQTVAALATGPITKMENATKAKRRSLIGSLVGHHDAPLSPLSPTREEVGEGERIFFQEPPAETKPRGVVGRSVKRVSRALRTVGDALIDHDTRLDAADDHDVPGLLPESDELTRKIKEHAHL